MKLVRFRDKEGEGIGALLPDASVLSFAAALKEVGRSPESWSLSMQSLIDGGQQALEAARSLVAASPPSAIRQAVQVLAPIPRPVRMRDCNLFTDHFEAMLAKLARDEAAKSPTPDATFDELRSGKFKLNEIFLRRVIYYTCDPMAVSGPDDEIKWPSYSSYADFELEWAAVIGKTGKDIGPEVARDHIFGFTIFNDWSARDEQMAVMPAGVGPCGGKDFDGSVGLGPCIVTADEFPRSRTVWMSARVNGEQLTRVSTGTMRHSFEDAIEQLSRGRTLYAGDIIASGTALGGCCMEHGRRLHDGDVVELEVEGIGVLRNTVRLAG